jgi:hypothetical protein
MDPPPTDSGKEKNSMKGHVEVIVDILSRKPTDNMQAGRLSPVMLSAGSSLRSRCIHEPNKDIVVALS